jgi:hypothetical protein
MRDAERSEAASNAARVHKHEVLTCGHGGHMYFAYLGGSGDEHRLLEVSFLRMRNARQSAAAPRSARVPKHQIHATLDGERVETGNLRGAGVSSSV